MNGHERPRDSRTSSNDRGTIEWLWTRKGHSKDHDRPRDEGLNIGWSQNEGDMAGPRNSAAANRAFLAWLKDCVLTEDLLRQETSWKNMQQCRMFFRLSRLLWLGIPRPRGRPRGRPHQNQMGCCFYAQLFTNNIDGIVSTNWVATWCIAVFIEEGATKNPMNDKTCQFAIAFTSTHDEKIHFGTNKNINPIFGWPGHKENVLWAQKWYNLKKNYDI